MVTKTTKGQKCPRCREANPKKAKYCMSCGKNMHPAGNNLWPGKILKMKKGFDSKVVVAGIFAHVDRQHIQFDPEVVTEEDLRRAFTYLSQKSQQILIRITGTDGKMARSNRQIAQEAGVRLQSVNLTSRHAFFHLALQLRLIRPSEEFRRRMESTSRRLHELYEQARTAGT